MNHSFFSSLLTLVCSSAFLFGGESEVIVKELKGVLLIPSQKEVQRTGANGVEGFQAENLVIPGGEESLSRKLSPLYIGHPLTKDSLMEIKQSIIRYYRDEGYPIVLVQIPEQNLRTGILQLVVIESKLNKIEVQGNRWFFDSFYKNKFSAQEGKPINSPDLLNDISWLNRNPFQNANAIYSPGQSPNTTDVTVAINDAFPLRFYAGADNTGNSPTQDTRLFAGCNWGYAFFLNQLLTYQYSTAPNLKSFWAHTFHYTAFLPWKNSLVLFGGLSGVKPEINDFKGNGNSYQASLRYEIPFKPFYTPFTQDLTAGCDFKRTNNNVDFVGEESLEVIGHEVNLFQFVAQYSLANLFGKNELSFSAELYGSPGQWLPDQKNSEYSALSFGAKNTYIYGRSSLSYKHYIKRNFSFLWFLRGQGSSANLLPSEELGIGGYDTVRGYDERIINVANGVIFNFEITSPPFPIFFHGKNFKDQTELLVFFDYGGGNYTKEVPGLSNWLQIYSIGPGFRYRIQNYLSFRFDWGYQLKKSPFSGAKNKIHLGAMLSY